MGDINLGTKLKNLEESVTENITNVEKSTIDLSNSAEGNIRSLHLYGKGQKVGSDLITSSGVVESANADNTQTSSINASVILDSTFIGVNDIKDELIVNADGTGKFIKRVGKATFDKNSFWAIGSLVGDIQNIATTKPTDAKVEGQTISSMFNCTVGGAFNFTVPTSLGITTVDGWKTYLGDNIITVVYELGTPTETTLTSSQVAQLLSLKSFRDTTFITSDCDYEIGYFKNNETGQSVADVNTKLSTLIETLKSKGVID